MDVMKSVYHFDHETQFLKIEFLTSSNQSSCHAYVFDENWNDIISTAAAISDTMADSIEYVYDSLGIRGRIAVLSDMSVDSLTDSIDVSLFHLQALLFASAIIVTGDYDDLESFGFSKEKSNNSGKSLYILSSEEVGNDACRFL
jgi:hypothetical protein